MHGIVELVVDLEDVVEDEKDEWDSEKSPRGNREREQLLHPLHLVATPIWRSLLSFATLDYGCNSKN